MPILSCRSAGVGSVPDAPQFPQIEHDGGTSEMHSRAEPPRRTHLTPQQVFTGMCGFGRSRIHNFWLSTNRKAAFEEWSGVFGNFVSQVEEELTATQKAGVALALLCLLDNMYKQEDMAWAQNWPPQAGIAPRAAPAGVDYLFVRGPRTHWICALSVVPAHTHHLQAKGLPTDFLEQSGMSKFWSIRLCSHFAFTCTEPCFIRYTHLAQARQRRIEGRRTFCRCRMPLSRLIISETPLMFSSSPCVNGAQLLSLSCAPRCDQASDFATSRPLLQTRKSLYPVHSQISFAAGPSVLFNLPNPCFRLCSIT